MTALTENDRAALREAVELIRTVVKRHPDEVTGPLLSAVSVAVQGIDNVQRYLEVLAEENV